MKAEKKYKCSNGCGRTRTIILDSFRNVNGRWPKDGTPQFPPDAGFCICSPEGQYLPEDLLFLGPKER